ncbi:DUF1989 domain-containing protein [Solirubrobacter soli]|uniref:DUF1989 domain-containing protein n=1 Tax=Solirubrobacter soli TaxID=363832 RepID=UPI00055BE79B|nr:urea carboxylase-associated family protein [Solirubrobacter soli]
MSGAAWRVRTGDVVRIVDLEGSQVADVFLVDAGDVTDGLSNGRTFDYGGTLSLGVGSELYSSRSRRLATIVHDDVGAHDFLYAPCSQAMFERQYAATGPHPNCYDNLTGALARFGVPAATVTIPLNVFMCTSVGPDGRLTIAPPRSRPGDALELRAERELLVAVSACSASGANGGGARPLGVTVRPA